MTGALVVEVLLAGAMSFIWILLLVIRIIEPSAEQINAAFNVISTASAIFLTLFAGVSYVLGWAISYLAETIFDPIFQTRFRDKYFGDLGLTFYKVRSRVFHNSPNHVIKDIEYDRQLIRIARSNSLNFLLIAIITISFDFQCDVAIKLTRTISLLSFVFGVLSFFQWRYRYKSTFYKFMDLYNGLITNEDFINGDIATSERPINRAGVQGNTSSSEPKDSN